MKRFVLLLATFTLLFSASFAQSDAGKLKGRVTDEAGDPVPYATVKLLNNGIVKTGANTDDNGEYDIFPISPGIYSVIVSFAGQEKRIDGVQIITSKTKTLDISMKADVEMESVKIYEPIEFDQTTSIETFNKNQVRESGYRDINSVIAIAAGAVPGPGGLSIRGGRGNATTYFVDGVKMRGVVSLPQKSIEQINVITGGTPAEYGDMIGGVVSITTAGPSLELTGGGEILTSTIFPKPYVGLDAFGYTLLGLNLSGPIITKFDSVNGYKKPILGFMVAGESEYNKDASPFAIGNPQLTDAAYLDYQENPLQLNNSGDFFIQRAHYVKPSEIINTKSKPYAEDLRRRITGRFDFQPADNVVVKLGYTYEGIQNDQWGRGNSLFAKDAGQIFEGYLFRGWGRFQQSFKGGKDSKLKNLVYMLQADYNVYHREFMNRDHKKNFFDYGYVGKFDLNQTEFFQPVFPGDANHHTQISQDRYYLTGGFGSTNMTFDATDSKNPLMANYNNYIFDYVEKNGISNPFFQGDRIYNLFNPSFLAFFGGLRNGDSPDGIYSLYSGQGSSSGSYSKFNYEQYRLTGQATAELGGHNIKIGFEFEQRTERFYAISARPLWTFMRQSANRHLANINLNPQTWELVMVDGVFQDTVHAPIAYAADEQTNFDKNLRSKLGIDSSSTQFVNIDALNPSTFSLDMFTADELLNNGNSYVGYYGYDYKGNRLKTTAPENFFTDKNVRPMNAFAPTYISGFIQDKFELEDIIFNIGLRVDRFDANQKVLKDNYVLYPTYSALEANELLGNELPSTVGENWVPYMDNATSPTSIVGYRDPSTNFWYDPNGAPTSSVNLRQGGTVQPYVKSKTIDIQSFKDYVPQTIVMPRLSFSFPISDQAVFFAHYDVLAQRPGQINTSSGSLLAGQISDYYYLQNTATIDVTNPNLKAERTIDYEVGFKQKVNDFMALSLSTFYREMRDMMQTQSIIDAYPLNYTTYTNLDFGTVKGFTAALNMLRVKNIRMNVSYTLQYATGTGSSFSSSRNAVNSLAGFTAIRNLLPLDFDTRHRITANVDYRFGGNDAKGPGLKLGKGDGAKTIYPLANMGLNSTLYYSSGLPYSANSQANAADVMGGINQSIQLKGTPNGSRLPGQFRIDMKIDKDFLIGGGLKKDKTGNPVKDSFGTAVKRHQYSFNVYLLLLNAFNFKNIVGVYKTSGQPDSDGFLSTGVGAQLSAGQIDPATFQYLYTLKANNPGNISAPRRIQLGIQFSF